MFDIHVAILLIKQLIFFMGEVQIVLQKLHHHKANELKNKKKQA